MDGVTGWNRFRNYEMSVWTLQDSYIATLKSGDPIIVEQDPYNNKPSPAMVWPQARAQGQIQNGQMEIDVDGTQHLSFDIPMYIYINGERIENPNWYNAVTKNVLISMRKIKVIFNKWQLTTREERSASTFEFIILKVQESHEQDNLICHVECEGLAFHELGKIGYKYSLSADEFYNQYYEWSKRRQDQSNGVLESEPIANIQYWMRNEKNGLGLSRVPYNDNGVINIDAMNPTIWYFDVRMAHSSLLHEQNVTSDKIYEEGYPSDWNDAGTQPTAYENTKEMARLVDLKESNIYNITQDLAEKFQVFCRYEYIYNNNYNIIGRVIVFYNNFLQEGKDVQTLMYPNSATKIMREMDSTDISTKMFVRSVDADDLYLGEVNIMDCSANMSREDYLLNFDYLRDIGTISIEQYNEVNKFLKQMRASNNKIVPLQEAWSSLSNLKPEIDAKVSNYKESIELDQERITENAAYIAALDAADGDEDGFITRDYRNPAILSLLKDSSNSAYDTYYVQLNQNDNNRGIQPDTLKLYKEHHTTAVETKRYGIGFVSWNKTMDGNLVDGTSNQVRAYSKPNGNFSEHINYKLTVKSTIGNTNDDTNAVTSLPSEPKQGWCYRVCSNNKTYANKNCNKGDILLYDGITWQLISCPNNYNYDKGYYLFEKAITEQVNGLTTEETICSRKGAKDSSVEYVTSIRHLYYTTSSKTAPKKPTIETSTTDATKIVNSTTVVDEWSSKIGVPDNIDITTFASDEKYTLYGSWEIKTSKGDKTYTDVATVTNDASNNNWKTLVSNGEGRMLTGELTGKYEYDEYHNFDRVTNLYVRDKAGSYNTYATASNSIATFSDQSHQAYNDIKSKITSINALTFDKDYPSDRRGKYVVIKTQTYHSNGNITYSYVFKYHDANDINNTPDNSETKISSIKPIFYLDTKNTTMQAKNGVTNLSVSESTDTGLKDKWTYTLPDKEKNAQKYYTGWAVTFYDNKTYYYTSNAENTNLKKKTKKVSTEEDAIPKYVYATYKYKPDWYYENIKNSWIKKLDNDTANKEKYEEKSRVLNSMITYIRETLLENELNDKKNKIRKFEHMMGAASRESYWQPEDEYQDYGSKYTEEIDFPCSDLFSNASTFYKNSVNKTKAYSGWDIISFDEERTIFYEVGANRDKVFYPCIDLSMLKTNLSNDGKDFLYRYREASKNSKTEQYAFFFNPTNKTFDLSNQNNQQDIRYCDFYTIGSRAHLALATCPGPENNTSVVIPILILTDAALLSDDQLQHLYETGYIGKVAPERQNDGSVLLKQDPTCTFKVQANSAWLTATRNNDNTWTIKESNTMKEYQVVYPRILIPSLKLKTDSDKIIIKYNGKMLEKFKDYYLNVYTYYKSSQNEIEINNNNYVRRKFLSLERLTQNQLNNFGQYETYYTITIKPEYILANHTFGNVIPLQKPTFNIEYYISNADTSIYLDAKQILKENAYPKVAYEIEVSKWSPDLLTSIYTKLAQIVMINDTDLKLQNTFGYISNIKLDLDHEEKDSIEVKNYKTKFEDLFSRIVAETEEMHKNSRNLSLAGALVGGQGGSDVKLSKKGMEDTLSDPSIQDMLQDFMRKYFDGADVVQKKLQELWNEAGAILGSAATSLNSVMGLTTENASILAGFRENVLAAMTPKIFTGGSQPTEFKPGDIWINDESGYRAVATGYGSSRGGFTRTYDGKLAEISGSSFGINADTGEIDIINETNINLMSGKTIYIAAGDNVDIVGNKAVNIGGTTINMASSSTGAEDTSGGIHLVSTLYNVDGSVSDKANATSSVDIEGSGITMASRNGIIIKSGGGIDIKSSDGSDTSAIRIDRTSGVYLGSTTKLKLYSGIALEYFFGPEHGAKFHKGDYWAKTDPVSGKSSNINSETGEQISYDENYYYLNRGTQSIANTITYYKATKNWDEVYNSEAAAKDTNALKSTTGWTNQGSTAPDIHGANVELSPERLLLGMSHIGEESATVIDMDMKQIIIAAGENLSKIKTAKNTSGKPILLTQMDDASITGIQIQSNYIGMATAVEGTRTIFSMTPELVQLGQMTLKQKENGTYYSGNKPEHYSGSYLWLAKDEIYIGSMGHFTLNTNNIKIQTRTIEDGNNTFGFALGTNLQGGANANPKLGFSVNGNTATLIVDGNITARQFEAISNKGKFIANGNKFGLYNSDDTGILTIDGGNITASGSLTIASGKNLTLSSNGNLNLNGADLKVDILKEQTTNGTTTKLRRFLIDTTKLKPNEEDAMLVIYEGNGFSNASSGIKFSVKNGLEIKLSAAAKFKIGTESIEDYAKSQATLAMTNDKIWAGVTDYTGSHTSLTITDSSFAVDSSGTFTVNSTNFVVSTDANNTDKNFFAVKDNNGNYILRGYKTKTTNEIRASIGGWVADKERLWHTLDNVGTMTLNYYHSTEQKYYAINAGDNFWVDYRGYVWLNKLMVWDPQHEITGTGTVHEGNYTAIDFSKLNFNSAISLTSEWSGTGTNGISITYTATLWGKFTKTQTDNATISVSGGTIDSVLSASSGSGSILGTINGQTFSLHALAFDTSKAYNAGYNQALSDAGIPNGGTVYKGNKIQARPEGSSQTITALEITGTYTLSKKP